MVNMNRASQELKPRNGLKLGPQKLTSVLNRE